MEKPSGGGELAMKAEPVSIRLKWKTAQEGGRKTGPMKGPQFVIPITSDSIPPELGSWSVVVDQLQTANNLSEATMRFLVEAAPHNVLIPGMRFQLMEGSKAVADGWVV